MSKTPNISEDNIEFRGDLNIQKIIYDQITLINHMRASNPEIYSDCVDQLKPLIPWQQQIEIEEEWEDYTTEIREWVPIRMDGELGSADPEHPDMINVPGTLRYNPKFNNGNPKQISPIWHEETKINFPLLFKKIMLKLQGIGYTHKQDKEKG